VEQILSDFNDMNKIICYNPPTNLTAVIITAVRGREGNKDFNTLTLLFFILVYDSLL
jgi:hypothetical protein